MTLRAFRKELESVPRYTPGTIRVKGWDIEYLDAASFVSAFDNVVVQRTNDFVHPNDHPVILDCGANIGVSVIHYKRQFPNAKILAFEPDKRICDVLRRNLKANGITDVEVIEAAVWTKNGETEFFSEGADAGRVHDQQDEIADLVERSASAQMVKVKTIALGDFLHELIDFIKLDIEGAESAVLSECVSGLMNVASMVVEFHLTTSRPSELGLTMTALSNAGFKVSVNSYGQQITLRNKDAVSKNAVEFDQYLLLEAWRN